jgi:hypothetical protein
VSHVSVVQGFPSSQPASSVHPQATDACAQAPDAHVSVVQLVASVQSPSAVQQSDLAALVH